MSFKKISLYTVFGLSILFFSIITWFDLSRYKQDYFFILKFIAAIVVFIVVLSIVKVRKSDFISMLGISIFILTLCFFTIINANKLQDFFILAGYILFYLIYFFMSKQSSDIHFYLRNILLFLGVLFIIFNLPFIIDPSAYTNIKIQFKGFFENPNAFTGFAGLFFVLNLYFFNIEERNFKKGLYLGLMLILAFYLFLGFSRASLLSTILASFSLLIFLGKKRLLFLFLIFMLVVFFVFSYEFFIFEGSANRSVFEETGRGLIFDTYFKELIERYFFIGTGVSIDAGRIKSELAYLDIFLMTGIIGVVGFFIFIFRVLYLSFFLKNKDVVWLSAVYIYIIIISIFEGYVANILSVNSLLFYVIPAMIYGCYLDETRRC